MITPTLEAELIFKAIETVISPSVIKQTLLETGSCEERSRKLPSGLVVCLVIAMNLWSSDAMGDVLKNLVSGLSREWTRLGKYWKVPTSSSISEAKQRLGCWVMSRLFHKMAYKPLCSSHFNVSSRDCCFHISITLRFYWYSQSHSLGYF
ncbi:MAG TPA: transposase domain-containing protein [Nostoc sp.]|nr:transposase domain-containing protein [Nostoc sp.]